jgi:hypothetical protein
MKVGVEVVRFGVFALQKKVYSSRFLVFTISAPLKSGKT